MLSNASAPLHPLRQTSFPPEQAQGQLKFSRSPSMDTMSLVSGVSAAKKKRGRPKGKANDNESIVGGRAKSAVSGVEGKGKRRASRQESVEEDEPDINDIDIEMEKSKAQRQKDNEDRALLVDNLDPEQLDRYGTWRSSKLPDLTVRKVCLVLSYPT